MKKFILLAAVLSLSAFLCAQATTTKSTTTTTKTTMHHHKHMRMASLGWKCHKHGEVCELDMEDILAEQDDPAHTGCDPASAIYVNVAKGQSLLIKKRDLKHADFVLTIEPDAKDKDKASPYPFTNMPPANAVPSWWTGPALGDPGTCYHLHVTDNKGQSGDPHIIMCSSGTLCQ